MSDETTGGIAARVRATAEAMVKENAFHSDLVPRGMKPQDVVAALDERDAEIARLRAAIREALDKVDGVYRGDKDDINSVRVAQVILEDALGVFGDG